MNENTCPQCGGPEANLLGALGTMVYLRCRACGWDYVPTEAKPIAHEGTP